MKLLILFSILFSPMFANSQSNMVTESNYVSNIKAKIPMGEFTMLDSLIYITVTLNSFKDDRFLLVANNTESIEGQVASLVNTTSEPDTVLYDLQNQLLYIFSEKKAYRYKVNEFAMPSEKNDSVIIQKSDTTIILLKKLDKDVMPFPTIGNFKYGVAKYNRRNSEMKLINTKKISFSILPYYDRVKNFPLQSGPSPIRF